MHNDKTGGIFSSLRQLSMTAIELLIVRLALIGNEIEFEKHRILGGLMTAILSLCLFSMGILFLCALLIFISEPDTRLTVIFWISILFLFSGTYFYFKSRKMMASTGGIFNVSVSELKKDLAHLHSKTSDG